MTASPRLCRVALADVMYNPNYFEFCRVAIDYGRYWRHWDLRGTINQTPFTTWRDLPWDELDGVICINLKHEQTAHAARHDVCTISVNPETESTRLPRVMVDYHAVGRLGASHLLERGYHTYAYIGDGSWQSQRQWQGFEQRLETVGRTGMNLIFQRSNGKVLLNQIVRWLETLDKPVAVMIQMDYLGRYVADAAVNLGLRLPSDVGVLGVNNNPWASIMAAIPISSIQLNSALLGRVAVQSLDQLMQGHDVEPTQLIPPLRVVTRQSTDTILTQDRLVAQTLQFIRDHAHEAIGVDDVLMDVQCSRSTLEKRMKSAIGSTIHHALTQARIEKVKQMLLSTDASTEQIAYHCGFQQQPRLFEAFKRFTGMTPGQYRQQGSHDSTRRRIVEDEHPTRRSSIDR